MLRRVLVVAFFVASAVILGGAAQGSPTQRHLLANVAPSGAVTCAAGGGYSLYTAPGLRNVQPAAGGFTVNITGVFSNCTGNAGNPVIGGTYTGVLTSLAGPRTCNALALTATYTGVNTLKVRWYTINPGTGQEVTYTSTSNALVSATAVGFVGTTVFTITGGTAAFVGTVTSIEHISQPAPGPFLADCSVPPNFLRGSGATTASVSVP
jgi:hypothetical protein